jgi:flavodoxin
MRTLVVYYSHTGNNRYLAEQVAHSLKADCEQIRPRPGAFLFLIMLSFLNIGARPAPLTRTVEEYDQVILVGPIWMGRLVSPLRGFLMRYRKRIKQLYFITCCGSTDAARNDTFGYATVFPKIAAILGERCVQCEALPIALVLPEDKSKDNQAIMNTRLSDENFSGMARERFNRFVESVIGSTVEEHGRV